MKILLLLLVAVAVQADIIQLCHLQSFGLTDREEKIAAHFEEMVRKATPIPYECLEFLMLRGFYKTSVELYEQYYILNQIDVSQQLQALIDREQSLASNRELQHIFKHSIAKSSKVQTVQPVIQWAQSKNHTLINIKFSLRVDAPACLNIKIEQVKIEGDKVTLSAFGIVSHQPIRYETTILLYKPIDSVVSMFKHEAVGTMYFNLTKVEPNDLWIRLTTSDTKVLIWWDLTDNLKEDMNEFTKMLEAESERREKSSDKLYRKNRKLKEKQKLTQDRSEKSRLLDCNQCYHIRSLCENGWWQRQ